MKPMSKGEQLSSPPWQLPASGSAAHHRGERRRSALSERLCADLDSSWRQPEYTHDKEQIGRAFRHLSEAHREILALSAWEGLGCSRNAVRIRLHRARKQFAVELANG
jgi:RNA polymerase sigma-70 factor (ECF subfamily)